MAKDKCEELFDIVESIGEALTGDLHIIDQSRSCEYYEYGEKEYRVYHKDGFCFDVFKKLNELSESPKRLTVNWYYDFFAEWDGFIENLTVDQAIGLVKPYCCKPKKPEANSTTNKPQEAKSWYQSKQSSKKRQP